jgi:hypothetical protein
MERSRFAHAHFVRSVLVVVAVLSLPSISKAQYPGFDDDLQASKVNTELVIADIRPKLFNDLPRAESEIYQQIHFDVSPDSRVMQAYAWKDGNTRRVTVTEAMGRALKLNVDAFLIEKLYHKQNFLGEYMSYVCSRYQANYPNYAKGLPPSRIKSPYELAHVSIDDLYSDADVNKSRAQIEGGAFAFLLAHEVAHHILNHVGHPSQSKQEQREREKAADDWAINLLVKKAINPVTGIVPMLFFYYTTRHPISSEPDRDHPADARRLLDMYEGLQNRLPQFRQYIVASGQSYDNVQKQIQISIKSIQDEIQADE